MLDALLTVFIGCTAGSAMLLLMFMVIVGFGIGTMINKAEEATTAIAETAMGVVSWIS